LHDFLHGLQAPFERLSITTTRAMADSNPIDPTVIESEGRSTSPDDSLLPPFLQNEAQAWDNFPWSKFPGWVKATRPGALTSWIWRYGFDIEQETSPITKKWVCQRCLKKKRPVTFAALGHLNIERHLHEVHSLEDPTGRRKRKRSTASPAEIPDKQRRIDALFKPNAESPRDQALVNALRLAFDRNHFQKLLINWLIESNLPFRTIGHPRLREIFTYLNPLIRDTKALITHPTVRQILIKEYRKHRKAVVNLLRDSPGFIHIAFDGWSSRNKHCLYGITCSFLDERYQVQKIVLGLPELSTSHKGENIAAEIIEILSSYGIGNKIGYFTLDNASNNDTAMEAIASHFGLKDGHQSRVRCIGHIINLVVKALLFGNNHQAFEEEIPNVQALDVAAHKLWQNTGPVGKLHNLVIWINRSSNLTHDLLNRQRLYNENNPSTPVQILRLVSDNATRWLSQFNMIERALKLRNFLEDFWDDRVKAHKRSGRSEKTLPLCLRSDSQLTASDWSFLEQIHKLLGKFNIVLRVLEGDGRVRERVDKSLKAYGLIWHVVISFEFMLETLEEAKNLLVDGDHANHWRVAVNCAWDVLDKYYQRLDDCPAYYAAVALHPRYRWRYFERQWADRPEWILSARAKVKSLWESEYKQRSIHHNTTTFQPSKTEDINPFDWFSRPASPGFSSTIDKDIEDLPDDEYERWQRLITATDTGVFNPLDYWYNKRFEYPRLAQMAAEILSIPPMSADCERLFSSCGLMVTPLRSRLEATTIGLAQTLRSWLKAGVIRDSVMNVSDLNSELDYNEDLGTVTDELNEDEGEDEDEDESQFQEDKGADKRQSAEDEGEVATLDD
jgi:hypothetical protein